uniref:Sel1 repeat family protein n=1 Tax=viral metagenome TaxID=1070528 RepID=A0A6C0EAY0_9ZZZZ
MAESPVALTIDDVRNYVPTNNIDRNTLMLLERLKYDEDICSFDDKICPAVKINWDLIKRILISKTDLNKKEAYYLGWYYHVIEQNYGEMKKYYNIAIEKGDTRALHNMATYYHVIEKNEAYADMYYKVAVSRGQVESMCGLGAFYKDRENYAEMEKYLKMAIDKGNIKALIYFGHYYETIKNYYEMKKYYILAIENGNTRAMCLLATYYWNIEKNSELMFKYFRMAIEKGDTDAMLWLAIYFQNDKNYDEMLEYYVMAIKAGNNDAVNNLTAFAFDNACNDGISKMILDKLRENRLFDVIENIKSVIGDVGTAGTLVNTIISNVGRESFDEIVKALSD